MRSEETCVFVAWILKRSVFRSPMIEGKGRDFGISQYPLTVHWTELRTVDTIFLCYSRDLLGIRVTTSTLGCVPPLEHLVYRQHTVPSL